MFIILLIASILNFASPREWILSPKISHGTMDSFVKTANYPTYSAKTFEYHALQIALDYENILPAFDAKHEAIYLAPLPKTMHENFKKRKKIYYDISNLKKEKGTAAEKEDGFLEATGEATSSDRKLIEEENGYRKELYSLICENIKTTKKDIKLNCNKVPNVYHNAIKYLKYYTLNESNSPSKPVESNLLISSVSSFKYKDVWTALLKVLKEEGFIVEEQDIKRTILTKYQCNGEERSFVLRVCSIKNQKPSECEIAKTAPSEIKNPPIDVGTIIWVEKKDSTLILSDDSSEEFDILLCNGTSDGKVKKRKFDILEEKLPAMLTKTKGKVKKR